MLQQISNSRGKYSSDFVQNFAEKNRVLLFNANA